MLLEHKVPQLMGSYVTKEVGVPETKQVKVLNGSNGHVTNGRPIFSNGATNGYH